MRVLSLIALALVLSVGVGQTSVAQQRVPVLSSLDAPKHRWEKMNQGTFPSDFSQTEEACNLAAYARADDPLEPRHCRDLQQRLQGSQRDCQAVLVPTRLPNGEPRVLDFLTGKDERGIFAEEDSAMELPNDHYPAIACDLGVNRGHRVVGLVFIGEDGCFNTAPVFVPVTEPKHVAINEFYAHGSTGGLRYNWQSSRFYLDCPPLLIPF